MTFVELFKPKTVLLVGDCEVALSWITSCVPKDKDAKLIVNALIDAQFKYAFVVKTNWKSNKEKEIILVDGLSKGVDVSVQELKSSGFARAQPKLVQW